MVVGPWALRGGGGIPGVEEAVPAAGRLSVTVCPRAGGVRGTTKGNFFPKRYEQYKNLCIRPLLICIVISELLF